MQNTDKSKADAEGPRQDLRSRGLCLVPLSSIFPVASHDTNHEYWNPTFGGTFRWISQGKSWPYGHGANASQHHSARPLDHKDVRVPMLCSKVKIARLGYRPDSQPTMHVWARKARRCLAAWLQRCWWRTDREKIGRKRGKKRNGHPKDSHEGDQQEHH